MGHLRHCVYAYRCELAAVWFLGVAAALSFTDDYSIPRLALSFVGGMGFPILVWSRHAQRPCALCTRDPAPPSQLDWERTLSLYHRTQEPMPLSVLRTVGAYVAGGVAGVFLPGPALAWAMAGVGLSVPYKIRLQQVHAQYRPWCKECVPTVGEGRPG